jgi:TonB family protein
MNSSMRINRVRKHEIWSVLGLALFVTALPLKAHAQAPPKPPASLQTMAQDLEQELSSRKNLKVVVLDFGAPDKRWLPFGEYLADQFAAELAKVPTTLMLIDRSQLAPTLKALHLTTEAQLDNVNNQTIAKGIAAECVIAGSYGDFEGYLGITLTTDCLQGARVSATEINRKIPFSPEMAARFGAPLESLRPAGGVPDAGTAGLSFPRCTYCPQPGYTNEAVIAKYQGTAVLTVVITAEGRASDIRIVQDLKYGLARNAVAAVSKWRFTPAHDPEGNAVSARQKVEVTFHLYSH